MFDLRNRRVCHNELYDIYFSRKQRAKCGPAADRLSCRISTKMDSQPCGGTIPNKPPQCVYSQLCLGMLILPPGFKRTEAFQDSVNHRLDPGLLLIVLFVSIDYCSTVIFKQFN